MVLADDITHRARRFLVLGGSIEAQLAHRIDDASLHRLQTIADEGQGAVQHHVHGVIEVGLLGIFLQRNLLEGQQFASAHRGIE